mmetsp:Transcript_37112/g.42161  ORF Transcript_37112/g.42161 Transcript_37112/m.42161 type:complete len:308 (+) Transcript_37112:138-1061(+)
MLSKLPTYLNSLPLLSKTIILTTSLACLLTNLAIIPGDSFTCSVSTVLHQYEFQRLFTWPFISENPIDLILLLVLLVPYVHQREQIYGTLKTAHWYIVNSSLIVVGYLLFMGLTAQIITIQGGNDWHSVFSSLPWILTNINWLWGIFALEMMLNSRTYPTYRRHLCWSAFELPNKFVSWFFLIAMSVYFYMLRQVVPLDLWIGAILAICYERAVAKTLLLGSEATKAVEMSTIGIIALKIPGFVKLDTGSHLNLTCILPADNISYQSVPSASDDHKAASTSEKKPFQGKPRSLNPAEDEENELLGAL